LIAYAVDAALVTFIFSATSAVTLWIAELVTARHVDGTQLGTAASAVLFSAWFLLYFGVSWATAGRTVGMTVFGLRVVRRDGGRLPAGRAWVRALTFPLSFVPFGLGFVGIVVGRERRALHDVCAGSTVVYDWETATLRLRTLARHA
jgi:uncharacterized RDD family membrane protein YckC